MEERVGSRLCGGITVERDPVLIFPSSGIFRMSEGRLAVRYVEILGHALFFWAYVLFFGFLYIVIIYIMDSREFNGTFWLSISAMLLSFVGILTVFCLKIKM